MTGYVKNNMDIKLMVLYALEGFHEPPTFEELSQVVLCDEGVDYFLLKQSISELQLAENLIQEGEVYRLTPRGKDNLDECVHKLVAPLQKKCEKGLKYANQKQRNRKFVKSWVQENPTGTSQLRLSLSDETGILFDLNMMVPNREDAEKISDCFTEDAITYLFALRDLAMQLTLDPPTTTE